MFGITWSKTHKCVLDKGSTIFEEPAVCEILLIMTEDMRICGASALAGATLMEFLGRNNAKDFGFPNTESPNPLMDHYQTRGRWLVRL